MCDPAADSRLLWRFMVLLCVLASLTHRSSGCPKSCVCYAPSEVHCTFRYLSEMPRDIQTAVERINLGYNSLSSLQANGFSGLNKLELLMLHSNMIKTVEDGAFSGLTSLQVLKMSYNRIEKLNKNTFRGLDNLVRLQLDHNLLTFIHPESFYGLKRLQLINLEGNQLQQLHPDTFISVRFGQIIKWSSLKTIYLSDNALSTLPAAVLSGCFKIENLFLSGNPWSCDCRMSWLAKWIEEHPGVLKCKRDKKFLKEPCPICEFPLSSRGSSIVQLQSDSYTCSRPRIHPLLKLKNFTITDSDYTEVSPVDFVAPIGSLEMNITDQSHSDARIACVVQRPTETQNLTAIFGLDGKDVTALRATVSTLLVCNIDYDNIREIWDILATYSDFPMILERELSHSLQSDAAYTYKQAVPTADDVFTEIEAKIKASPEWLMQGRVMLQLDRATTAFPTLTIKYLSTVQLDVGGSKNNKNQYSWTMIRRDNQTRTEHLILVGGMTELNCQTFGNPKPIIEWILPDGSKIRAPYNSEDQRIVITHEGILSLKSAEISDMGVYHCIAISYLDADVLAFRVTVMPLDIEEDEINGIRVSHHLGQNLLLDCTSASSPQASIQWILPDHTVLDKSYDKRTLHRNGTLVIHGLTYRDTGFYRCVAGNFMGVDLLASQVTVYDDLSNSTIPAHVKESNRRVVQIIDDSQTLESRYLSHRTSEESRSITSDRPYTWLKSRFHKVPIGRRWNGRNSRRVLNKKFEKEGKTLINKPQIKGSNKEAVSLEVSKTFKEQSDDNNAASGDGISEDEFIVMTTTKTLEKKQVSTINTEIPKTYKTVNSAFIEVTSDDTSNVLRAKKKTNLVTISDSQTSTPPITPSHTLSNYRTQSNDKKQSKTKSDYILNHTDGETSIYDSARRETLMTHKPSLTEVAELMFSGDSEDVTTGTIQYNFQSPNVTYMEPKSQTLFTAVTTTEDQEKITFQTTQRIKSELLPGSTIISKHQIQIVPSKKLQSGKKRKFNGRRRIIRPNKIADIQSLLDKFKLLSINKEDNLTISETTDKITECVKMKSVTSGVSTDKCRTSVDQSLINSTDMYHITISSLSVTEKPVRAGSGKSYTPTDSQMSTTLVHSISEESGGYKKYFNSKEENLAFTTATTSTTTMSSQFTQGKIPWHGSFENNGKTPRKHQNSITLSTNKEQMTSASTAELYKSTTPLPTTELQLTHINVPPTKTKENNNTPDTSSDDSSGSSSLTDFSDNFITPSKSSEVFTSPTLHELSTTTEPTGVSHTLVAPPTIKTVEKQETSQNKFSRTGLWRKQKPGYHRRGFRGRRPIKKTTTKSPVTTMTKIAVKSATTQSTNAATLTKHRGAVIQPLHPTLKESERPASTGNTDSGSKGWSNSLTTKNTIVDIKPTVTGQHTTVRSQFQRNTKKTKVNTNIRGTPERFWRHTTQSPVIKVQPTTHEQTDKDKIDLQPIASANSQSRTVTSETMTGSTAFTFTPFPYTRSTTGNFNAYGHSTWEDTSSLKQMTSKPMIDGGKAASFTVLSNSDAFLPCKATGNPEPIISWNRFSSTTGIMLTIKGKMGKFEVLKNGTLLIQRTNIKDHGQYICIAENDYGSDKLVVTLSVVAYPARILETKMRELKILAGKTVHMACRTEGRPVPIVSWILPNHTEVKGPNGEHGRVKVSPMGTLTIQEVSVLDHGHYKCVASNPGGTDTATVHLQVVATPPVILEEKQQLVKVDAGQNLFLPCTTHGDPQPTTHWVLHNGIIVLPLTYLHTKITVFANGTLYLRNLDITESGKYECIATSSTGSERRVVTLSVKRTETIPRIIVTSKHQTDVEYGGQLHLNCSAVGNPAPEIIWRLPSKVLVDKTHRMGSRIKVLENGTLIIESLNEKDTGDFLCVARNKVGDDTQQMKVSVSMKPARIEPSVFSRKQVPYGNDLKVDCVAAGVPMPEISWGLPDGTLVNSALQADETEGDQFKRYILFNNGTLYLNTVGTDEEGDYTCYAENKLGKDKMHVHISVLTAAPYIQHPKLSNARVNPGGNVRFDCKAIGEPKPKVFWMLPSKDIIAASNERYFVHANGSLDIRNVKLSDAGEYVCMARNAAGEENKVYKLDIEGNPPIINGFKQNRTVVKETAVKYTRKLIDCNAEGDPAPKITWIMPDNIFLTAPYYGSRINVHINGTLEIRNIRPSDTAEFICIAQNDGGEAVMLVQLEVTEKLMRPIFKNPFNERVVTRVGRTAVLNCSADGQPTPHIIWTLPNRTRFIGAQGLEGSRYRLGRDGTFVIYNSSIEDSGKYRCAAKNKVGYIEKLVVFEVIQKPYILTRPKGIIRGISGQSLFLHCLTDDTQSTISWTTPGGFILARPQVSGRYQLMDNGTLVVHETTMQDRGNYVCRATNDAGEAVLAVSVIIIAYPARITNGPPPAMKGVSGVPVHLQCVANGIPTPDIIWELPDRSILATNGKGQPAGSELLQAQGTLIIRNPTRLHSGNYKCIAFNYLGRDTRTTFMTII
ncbi:immunoglobulin superfamily member 10 [Danio aesculapii]|uniref:immunoglobulin superfamily member 10 n=1 Tax=Danio aesculapii TaxID=1142201 RepID=UPI0024C0BAB2|nr:immunoglobulin superfamily member 10 [Danio aesculapii]